jgi:hypothetical protein
MQKPPSWGGAVETATAVLVGGAEATRGATASVLANHNPGQHGSLVQESGVRRHGKQNLPGGSPMVQIPVHD